MHHNDIYIYLISTFTFRFLPRKCTSVVREITRDFFGVIQHCTWILQYNKLCSFYVSASPNQLVLLVIGRMTLIREYTVLIGNPIAVQILTHNPSCLSPVSRYPVAFEFPRAEARHHQPDLPRAPTPRAFERVSSLLHCHLPAYPVPYVSSLIIQHYR